MMDQNQNSNSCPDKMDPPKFQYTATGLLSKNKYPPLESGNSTKIGGVWNLKHEISSTKLYELLINTELKGETSMDLNILYNHINMGLNAVTRLRGYLLPDHHSIKRHSEFQEYFFPDSSQPSYYRNSQT